jgi:hypothetical protein
MAAKAAINVIKAAAFHAEAVRVMRDQNSPKRRSLEILISNDLVGMK